MRHLLMLVGACAASVLLYTLVFGYLVHSPMATDVNRDYRDLKVAYARDLPSPKILIIAGSNARVSHRCSAIEEQLGVGCVNGGISANISTYEMFDIYRSVIKPRDIIYIPLEYHLYISEWGEMFTKEDARYLFLYEKGKLFERGVEGFAYGMFSFDLSTLFRSLFEMALTRAGVDNPFSTAAMNGQGNSIGHTAEKAAVHREELARTDWQLPTIDDLVRDRAAQQVLMDFMAWAEARGALVVGGLPTTFADRPPQPAVIAKLRALFEEHGALFLRLPEDSLYPRDHFFDSPYHLSEPYQIEHSVKLAQLLRPLVDCLRQMPAAACVTSTQQRLARSGSG